MTARTKNEPCDIAQKLRQRRREKEITMQQLAEYIGFKYASSISRLEHGQDQWKLNHLKKACELLQMKFIIVKEV